MESRPMSAQGRMGGDPCENCVLMEEYRLRGERRGIGEAHPQADIFGNKNLVFLLRKRVPRFYASPRAAVCSLGL